MKSELSVRVPRVRDVCTPLLFLYFVTLHADQLSLFVGGMTLRLNNLIALLLLIAIICRYRQRVFHLEPRLFSALLVLSLAISLSCLLSPYKKRCCFFLGWYGATLLFYVLLPYLLLQIFELQKVLRLYLISFLVTGLYALIQIPLGPYDPFSLQPITHYFYRPNAFAYEPSYYALYMAPFVMGISYYYLATKKHARLFVLANLLFLISTTTTALFAYMVFLIVALPFLRRRLLRFVLFATLMGAVIALCFPHIAKNYFMKFFFHGFTTHPSFFERWIGMVNAWTLFTHHPILGVGLGGLPCALSDAWAASDGTFYFLIDELPAGALPLKAFEATNVGSEILASLGLFGMGAFLLLLALFFAQCKGAYSHAPHFVGALFVSVVVMLIVLQFNQGVLRTYIWVHFTLAYALLEKLAHKHACNDSIIGDSPREEAQIAES